MEEKEQRQFQKRIPASKVSIKDILTGSFVREDGSPTYLQTALGEKVLRVNVVSSVLIKNSSPTDTSIIIDDGTGQLLVRSFDNPAVFDEVNAADSIMAIGKVREFNNIPYLSVELLKKLDQRWISVRKLELEKRVAKPIIDKAHTIENEEEVIEDTDKISKSKEIINLVRSLDKGDGVNIAEIIKQRGESVKEEIMHLIKRGDIFELRAGVLKVLE